MPQVMACSNESLLRALFVRFYSSKSELRRIKAHPAGNSGPAIHTSWCELSALLACLQAKLLPKAVEISREAVIMNDGLQALPLCTASRALDLAASTVCESLECL